jgi:hypothetical protein
MHSRFSKTVSFELCNTKKEDDTMSKSIKDFKQLVNYYKDNKASRVEAIRLAFEADRQQRKPKLNPMLHF